MTPLVLGRYQLLREIASGGMATVYAARAGGAGGFQKLVAVKRMLPHMTSEKRFKDMFLDEARLTANIRSPYAVATLDLGEAEDGSLYLVMDLVIGASLADILRGCIKQGRVLPVPAVVEIIEQAARGLHDAHEATSALGEPLHIVHRDVSPQNILVGIDGASRITDFGVAHALERLTKTKGRNIKGKIAYCSPEQAQGEPLDARSDIFALGIVLWEALTHRRLFKGHDAATTIKALLTGEIPDPRTLRPEIPPALVQVVSTALHRNPSARYQTALDFAEALRRSIDEHVRTEDLRDLVKLIAGANIKDLVADIRATIEASSPDGAHSWDDGPTEIDTGLRAHDVKSDSHAETLKRLKATGAFLARPPSEAMLAASSPSGVSVPAAGTFSSTFDGPTAPPKGFATPGQAAPPAASTRSKQKTPGRWGLFFALVCIVSALVVGPALFFAFTSMEPAGEPVPVAPGEGLTPNGSSGAPIAPLPSGRAAPEALVDEDANAPIELAPGFTPPLFTAKSIAGGSNEAHALSNRCVGFIGDTPQHTLVLSERMGRLRVFVHSDINTNLVIRAGDGDFFCNDDAEGLNPVIDRDFPSGHYEIFVGSPVASQHPEYTLGISESPEYSPSSLGTVDELEPDRPGLEPLRRRPRRDGMRGSMRSIDPTPMTITEILPVEELRVDMRQVDMRPVDMRQTEVANPWDNGPVTPSMMVEPRAPILR